MEFNGFQILISGSYNVFDEGWNNAGVYMASGNYVSQVFNPPIYIGSTNNLSVRIEETHQGRLNKNKHENPVFQIAWNNHAKTDGFIWFLLETCEPTREMLLETEQKYLDLYRPFVDEFGGFNVAYSATSPNLGKKFSEEHRRKIGESQIGRIFTPETRAKISATKKKQNLKFTDEHKKKISDALRKRICSEETKKKLSESNAKRSCAKEVGKRLGERNRGRKISDAEKESRSKSWRFLNPNGKIIEFKNLVKFCEENNLTRSSMAAIHRGNYCRNTYQGYMRAPDINES